MELNVKCNDGFVCAGCCYGKQKRFPFKSSSSYSSNIGELVHSDVCGPMEIESCGGSRYFVLFKDDYSNFRTVYMIKTKDEVKVKFVEFMKKLNNETGQKIKIFRTDNGTEFLNNYLKDIFIKYGIKHETTIEYTPQQNGKSEREIRTIVEMARTLIHSKNVSKQLWAEAVNTSVYILNRSTVNKNDETPFESWYKKPSDISYFRVFGPIAYSFIQKEKRKKSKKGIFVGYSENKKGYRIYFKDTNAIEISRDVIQSPKF